MGERILNILGRFRGRLLAVRAAEAAAVAGAAGALVAAFLMAARILTGPYPAAAAALCAVPLVGGIVLAAWPRARAALSAQSLLQWYVAALLIASGSAALTLLLAGDLAGVPKNALFLIAPASAGVAAVVVLARGASLGSVAVLVDGRAALAERLSTAWELYQAGQDSSFARAVAEQAAAAAGKGGHARVRFWDRTPATLGALGLALAAAALMLPWQVLESPQARRVRLWRQVGPQAGDVIGRELSTLNAQDLAGGRDLARQLGRLEALTKLLRSARPDEARQWKGKVVELDRIAKALREIVRSGRADAATTRRIERLLDAVERASSDIAEAMSGPGGPDYARPDPGGVETDSVAVAPPAKSAPQGWTTVFNPRYAELAELMTSTASAGGDGGSGAAPAPQLPYDEGWSAAQARAAEAMSKQPIPAEYRRLIRDFFAAGQ